MVAPPASLVCLGLAGLPQTAALASGNPPTKCHPAVWPRPGGRRSAGPRPRQLRCSAAAEAAFVQEQAGPGALAGAEFRDLALKLNGGFTSVWANQTYRVSALSL